MLRKSLNTLHSIPPQTYINATITGVGLLADIISLALFFGALNTPVNSSNFYVNSREYLAWVLMAIIYSLGLGNALVRRRWRKLYGSTRADHSILNVFWWFEKLGGYLSNEEEADNLNKQRNFKRDFSFLFVIMFPVIFLFNRAVNASSNTATVTPSPWGDLTIAFLYAFPITIGMMIVTSMFDFAMSIFAGDQEPLKK